MLIRPETPADIATIREVTLAAFTDAKEAQVVDDLRADSGFIPALSLVAVDDAGAVVGHVMCTRSSVADVPVLGLGPLSVRPDRQRAGVGKALVHTVLGAADALGEPLVVLLGSPKYYGRFGFRPSIEIGIEPRQDDWNAYLQVRTLSAYDPKIRGRFTYAGPLERL